MNPVEIIVLAIGVSMDACAVALTQGFRMQPFSWRKAATVALFFGGFQAAMPLVGWLLGSQAQDLIAPVAPWVAFGLLAILGANMLREAFSGTDHDATKPPNSLAIKSLLVLSVATSIDALAVGVSFAALNVTILSAVAIIGVTTFAISLASVYIGQRIGDRLGKAAEIAGGLVLIGLGVRILLDHLGT